MVSVAAFESINDSASPQRVEAWTTEEAHAQQERMRDVKVMDIYDIKMKQCESEKSMIVQLYIRFQLHPVPKYFWS
jgi:hypothetical protein